MSDACYCDAGERCSCGLDEKLRARCNLWRPGGEATKVYGLLAFHSAQKPLIEKHCFGDCGKVSMAGVIADDQLGGLWVCCEEVCPWLDKQMDEPYGKTNSFGRPHVVYLRTLTDTPQTASAQAAGSTQTCGPANAAVQPPANKGARKP